jgi:hypothetical protein
MLRLGAELPTVFGATAEAGAAADVAATNTPANSAAIALLLRIIIVFLSIYALITVTTPPRVVT